MARTYPSRAHTAPGSTGYYEALLDNPNVQRGLSVIRTTEGTAKRANPYAVGFGFAPIDNLSWHPGTSHSFSTKSGKKQRTTAAGAYQFLSKTWNGVASKLGLTNFGPRSQDIAALALIDARGGLNSLVKGDLRGFINAVGPEWASLPSAPKEYDQPTKSWGDVERAWGQAGVDLAGAPLPPQRYQTVAARSVAPNAQNMRTAATLGALPMGGKTQLPAQTFGAPLGRVERAPLQPVGALSPKQVSAYQDYANTRSYAPVDPVPTRPAAPAPSMNNIPRAAPVQAPQPPSKQASVYQQYAQSRMAGPLTPPPSAGLLTSQAPISPPQTFSPKPATPTFVPAAQVPAAPPAPVTQQFPVAPPPPAMQVQRLQSQEFPAAPPSQPQLTASDIYNGQTGTAQATGGNSVSRFENNPNTYVTNQYGVTTATGPNGNQMAVGGASGPGIGGPLGAGGIPTPPSDLGNKVKGGLGSVVGGGLGGFLAGPVGAALGAVVAGDLARGRNPLDRLGIGTFGMPVTDAFGFTQQMRFANPQSGGAFPNAPSRAGALGGRESNLTDRQMRDISPRAADAISKGVGGLY